MAEKKSIKEFVGEAQIIAIYCNQWGDTGKGKFSDYFSSWADVIARGNGGNNAGHTVVVNEKKRIFHLLPAGIVYDAQGKINLLGKGMVIDLKVLNAEIKEIMEGGGSVDNLMISSDAHVIMPYHVAEDKKKNESQKNGGVGSTGRGIGPCYSDKVARRGIKIGDLFDKEKIKKKIGKAKPYYSDLEFETEEIIEKVMIEFEKLKKFVKNTDIELHKMLNEGKKLLIEGAQGLFLSIEHGTYPYVTSSDSSLNGMAAGVGISAKQIDLALGIVKFPFMTRVGAGPFPGELGGKTSEKYCAEEGHEVESELEMAGMEFRGSGGDVSYDINSPKIKELLSSENLMEQSRGLRLKAGEYGATTGRPRRVGWVDAVMAKYAACVNGPLFVLTKADVISGLEEFKICYGYKDKEGNIAKEYSSDPDYLYSLEPVFKTYKGYGPLDDVTEFENLPDSLKKAIKDFEEFTGGRVVIVSTGADREATILR